MWATSHKLYKYMIIFVRKINEFNSHFESRSEKKNNKRNVECEAYVRQT